MPRTEQNIPQLNEIAVRELQRNLRFNATWAGQVPSRNEWVNNDIIKINTEGIDPEVLIDNTTYPIDVVTRADGSVIISLHKYDTKNTKVTEDELYALPYDKIGSVQQQHRITLEEVMRSHGLHSIAPAADAVETPVLETTGEVVDGRKRLTTKDVIALGRKLTELKVSMFGRVLILAPEHKEDLLIEDINRFNMTTNQATGALATNFYGFELYEDVYTVKYDAGAKVAFDAVPAGTAKNATICFTKSHTAKALGSMQRFAKLAEINPEYRESVLGFRAYGIFVPLRKQGQAALVSAAG